MNSSKISPRGFTLIELLVVISIIGMLASIVLVSLRSAKDKAADARIQEDMLQVRNEIALYQNNNSTFFSGGDGPAACSLFYSNYQQEIFLDQNIIRSINDALLQSGKSLGDAECSAGLAFFVISVPLKSDPVNKAWCVDSQSASKAEQRGNSLNNTTYATCR